MIDEIGGWVGGWVGGWFSFLVYLPTSLRAWRLVRESYWRRQGWLMNGWVGGSVGFLPILSTYLFAGVEVGQGVVLEETGVVGNLLELGDADQGAAVGAFGWWVGGWVGLGWVEEKRAVGMSYCKAGFGWVGGWVGGWGTYCSRCLARGASSRSGPPGRSRHGGCLLWEGVGGWVGWVEEKVV